MNRRIAFPFLVLSEDAIGATPWAVSLNDDEFKPMGEFLEGWDSASSIRIRRSLNLDFDRAVTDLQIPMEHLALSVAVHIGTGAGSLPRMVVDTHDYALDLTTREVRLEFAVPGDQLSLVLDLFTEIVLARVPADGGRLTPSRVGDRVWYERQRIRLEGMEPRFPVEVVTLDELLRGKTAGDAFWYLDWSSNDWFRDFHGAIRLFLNNSHPHFVELVEQQDPHTLRIVLADAMSQICERFVTDEDLPAHDFEEGTLGVQAARWLDLAWPGQGPQFVRSVLAARPGEFRAAFLGVADLGEN